MRAASLQLRSELPPHCPEPCPPTWSFAPLGTWRPNGDCTTGLSCEPGAGPRHGGEGRMTREARSLSPWPAAAGEMRMGAVWGQATRAEVLSLWAQQSWRGQCWGGHF